jgi:hypothetical protein
MTTYGPARTVAGDTEPAEHLGWNGIPFMMAREFGEHLEFAHLFNTVTPSVFPTADGLSAVEATRGDHSWNGRHATRYGATPDTAKFTGGASSYYELPLTGREFFDIGGEMTIVIVPNYTNTANYGHVIGDSINTAQDNFAFGFRLQGGANYHFMSWYASETDTAVVINGQSWTGTGPELQAITVTSGLLATMYLRNPLLHSQYTGSATLPAAPGSTVNKMRVGRSVGTLFTTAHDVYAAFGFSKAFSADEIADLFEDIKDFMLTQGITVLW